VFSLSRLAQLNLNQQRPGHAAARLRLDVSGNVHQENPMTDRLNRLSLVAIAALLMLASCSSSDKKPESSSAASEAKPAPVSKASDSSGTVTRVVDVEPGVAGGMVDETVTATAKIKSVDAAKRTIALIDDDGNEATFDAGPEVRNFDQLKAGDTITATLKRRMTVYVRPNDGAAGNAAKDAYAAAIGRAPKGAKPGALAAEDRQIVATVSAIDTTKRIATLKFSDGKTVDVPVRADVDLSRYKVGDQVIIRVTTALAVVASKP
jgi:hypothetical protein